MENLQGGTLALEHRYEVEHHEGRRGLINRYRGTQTPFAKPVEILVWHIFEESTPPEAFLDQLKSASEQAAELTADGVARVLDFGEIEAGVPFVVLEQKPGQRLTSVLENQGTLSVEDTVGLAGKLAQILDSASMPHGGLGAHQVRVSEDFRQVAVAEFGLSLGIDKVRQLDTAIMDFELVAPKSPEAFDGPDLPSKATDAYALATLAYSALAGVHPYFDDLNDTSEGLIRIKSDSPAPLTDFGVEQEISDVVERALSRKKKQRFKTPTAFAEALAATQVVDETEVSSPGLAEPSVEDVVEELLAASEPTVAPEPSPRATTFGLLLFVLVVSNLAWLYHASIEASKPEPQAVDPANPLIRGIEISSNPVGARVVAVTDAGDTPLGETPLVVDPGLNSGSSLQIKLVKSGFDDTLLNVHKNEMGGRVEVELKEPRND